MRLCAGGDDEQEYIRLNAQIEKQEAELEELELEESFLYSDKKGDVVNYVERVTEMEEGYKDLMYNLSRHTIKTKSGELLQVGSEGIETIKRMTVESLLDYSKRFHNSLDVQTDARTS